MLKYGTGTYAHYALKIHFLSCSLYQPTTEVLAVRQARRIYKQVAQSEFWTSATETQIFGAPEADEPTRFTFEIRIEHTETTWQKLIMEQWFDVAFWVPFASRCRLLIWRFLCWIDVFYVKKRLTLQICTRRLPMSDLEVKLLSKPEFLLHFSMLELVVRISILPWDKQSKRLTNKSVGLSRFLKSTPARLSLW